MVLLLWANNIQTTTCISLSLIPISLWKKKNKNQKNYSQPDFSVQTWEINEGELKVLNYTGWLNEYKY